MASKRSQTQIRNSAMLTVVERCNACRAVVDKIIYQLTYQVYRYMNRCLFERDKLMFKLIVTMKIMTMAGQIGGGDVSVFLKAGSALDIKAERKFNWVRHLRERVTGKPAGVIEEWLCWRTGRNRSVDLRQRSAAM